MRQLCGLLVSCFAFTAVLASHAEERLVENLFKGYNRLVRPVENISDIVTVSFGLALIQIINVDEKNQILKTNVWERYGWYDYQLRWDPAEYSGINSLRVAADKVWIPDIVLFNNADGNYEVSFKCNVVISSNGHVLWVPPAIFQSSCTIDVTYFPFDEQKCEMKFGSWTFNGDQVQLKFYEGKSHVDLNDYVKSGTWDVVAVPATLHYNNSRDKVTNEPRTPVIKYSVRIRRKTLFYTVNLVIPCVLLSFLSVLVFYLPVDCGEKMTLAISLLLALVVFLLLVSKILPPTSLTIPLVAKYLLFTFIMNIITILVTVIIINWNFRGPTTHRMPKWFRLVFIQMLPKFLCITRPVKEPGDSGANFGSGCNLKYSNLNTHSDMMELTNLHHPKCKHGQRGGDKDHAHNGDTLLLSAEAHRTASAIDFIAEHLRMEDEVSEIKEDWQYIAMVIDRLLLYIFFAVTAAGTAAIMLNPNADIFKYIDQDQVIADNK